MLLEPYSIQVMGEWYAYVSTSVPAINLSVVVGFHEPFFVYSIYDNTVLGLALVL
ncbi:hypothetical protein VHARVF571_60035 [Vibrio harveyi]|nr:hypothetical protein VHARVF571_60035 [Vibrio harveyi]